MIVASNRNGVLCVGSTSPRSIAGYARSPFVHLVHATCVVTQPNKTCAFAIAGSVTSSMASPKNVTTRQTGVVRGGSGTRSTQRPVKTPTLTRGNEHLLACHRCAIMASNTIITTCNARCSMCLQRESTEAKTMTLADSHFFMSINPEIICTYIKYYWIDILSYISIE
jgi:hypothetical protein